MAQWQTHPWTVEECAVVTASQVRGVLPRSGSLCEGDLLMGGMPITYTSTPCPYGGWRIWLLCPYCCRKAYKLYLPPSGRLGCRICHDVTYESRRRGRGWLDHLFRGAKAEIELAAFRHRRGRRPKRFYRLLRDYQAGIAAYNTWSSTKAIGLDQLGRR